MTMHKDLTSFLLGFIRRNCWRAVTLVGCRELQTAGHTVLPRIRQTESLLLYYGRV